MTEQGDGSVREIRVLLASARGAGLVRLLALYADDARSGVRSACEAARTRNRAERRERERLAGLYSTERALHQDGFLVVAGVDEVGRGALAGPLTAAAVVLPPTPRIAGLDDSKRLSPQRREELAEQVRAVAITHGVAHVSATEIDALGMTAALRRVVALALAELDRDVDHVVLDGLPLRVTANETAVVRGDSKVAAIAAASILAKVTRDALMRSLAAEHPAYGFDVNKGYGTSEHLHAVKTIGLSPEHRRSFSMGGGTMPLF